MLLTRLLSFPIRRFSTLSFEPLRCVSHSSSSLPATQVVASHHQDGDIFNATSPPIYQTATFGGLESGNAKYDYTRSGNPTREAFETAVARLENARFGHAFSSGMAALSSIIRGTVSSGGRIVAGKDIYGGLHRLLNFVRTQNNIDVEFVDMRDLNAVQTALSSSPTQLVFVESPSNPMMDVVDIKALSSLCTSSSTILCVDNSIMSPLLCNPLQLGADIVMHSATKFLAGHADVMAGVVATNCQEIADKIAFIKNAEGNGLAPHDSFLASRGLKTLDVRMNQAQTSCSLLASFLASSPHVEAVFYHHPESDTEQTMLHYRQARGPGAVLSFIPRNHDVEFSKRFLENTKLKKTVSFGSVHTTVEMPALHSHASIPDKDRHVPQSLIRISCGIEDPLDIISEVSSALYKSNETRAAFSTSSPKLGSPLPPCEPNHACGASLPSWRDVVGYEEADPRVHAALTCGYPRFVYPPHVRQLIAKLETLHCSTTETAIPTPSARVALRLQKFILTAARADKSLSSSCMIDPRVKDVGYDSVHAVIFDRQLSHLAKAYWQHSGELVSSRCALSVLKNLEAEETSDFDSTFACRQGLVPDARYQLRRRIAQLSESRDEDVFLYQSGMGAISGCNRLLQTTFKSRIHNGGKYVVMGFPYLDTLKQLQHPSLSPGAHYIQGHEFDHLEMLCQQKPLLGVIIEYPSNPLLQTVDIQRLRQLADQYDFPIILDDSIGGLSNVKGLGSDGADIVVSSLTKSFSGKANVMGGALTLNPDSQYYSQLSFRMVQQHKEVLFHQDAVTLFNNSQDYEMRNETYSNNAEALADYLVGHSCVQELYYPKFTTTEFYQQRARDPSKFGGLLSFTLKHGNRAADLYDALNICKGPGFGTNFTLACPYTLLAHYNELDFAESQGVSRNLLRVWTGLEPVEEIIEQFDKALHHLETTQHFLSLSSLSS